MKTVFDRNKALSRKLLESAEFAKIKIDGLELQFAPEEMKESKDVVISAVKQNGLALQFASPKLLTDLDVLRTAVNQNKQAYYFVPKSLRSCLVLQVVFSPRPLFRVRHYQLLLNRWPQWT